MAGFKLKVFVMRYVDGGRQRWFDESMDSDTAFAMGKRFARLGRKPMIVRIDATPSQLLGCGVSRRRRIA